MHAHAGDAVIHASDVSEEAALISVDAPTLPGACHHQVGEQRDRGKATRHAAAIAAKATRSLPIRPSTIDATTHAKGTLRAMTAPAALPARERVSPRERRTVATANSTRAATWHGTHRLRGAMLARPAGAPALPAPTPAEGTWPGRAGRRPG